jgi:hypothetical protein
LRAGLDRHWESHVYCGKKGVSWDLQQPTSAILSAIVQHLSGISSRTAQTRAASAVVGTGADESMNHDWAVSIGLDPTLTLTSATGNISQFTSDAYVRSHVMLMLRSAAESTMQAMASLAPKIAQLGVYNRDLCAPLILDFLTSFAPLIDDAFFSVAVISSIVSRQKLTRDRYENPLLLALAGKHAQFKELVASSLASLGQLDFTTAVQKAHSARGLALQLAKEAPKGSCAAPFCSFRNLFHASLLQLFSCSCALCNQIAKE